VVNHLQVHVGHHFLEGAMNAFVFGSAIELLTGLLVFMTFFVASALGRFQDTKVS
jgi:hypothetical protein